ncbi:MAG: hypothetical protein LCI00_17480 [Chloroflexi bacterium]|nr:hypothetical protein [Chloroflexota bacterium]MCC6896706.1 hypothetical protein [Anaerolineae bacterium]
MPDSLTIIQQEIARGHVVRARKILRVLLEETPTSALWYLASTVCETPEQEMGCLKEALRLDRNYMAARRRYVELKQMQQVNRESEMPPLMVLVDDLPMPEPERPEEPDPFTVNHTHYRRSQRRWAAVSVAGTVVMSLSSAYFVLTLLGSPIPAQIRSLLSGERPVEQTGQPIFGSRTGSGQLNTPNAPLPPVSATNENYSAAAAASGFVVQPNKSAALEAEKPVNDVLDPGFAHEYVLAAKAGEELAVAVQFFSPTAKDVGSNMAMLDPDGLNASAQCERGSILTDGSSVTYICKINKTGNWRLQLFGHSGESTGVYIVTYQRM